MKDEGKSPPGPSPLEGKREKGKGKREKEKVHPAATPKPRVHLGAGGPFHVSLLTFHDKSVDASMRKTEHG